MSRPERIGPQRRLWDLRAAYAAQDASRKAPEGSVATDRPTVLDVEATRARLRTMRGEPIAIGTFDPHGSPVPLAIGVLLTFGPARAVLMTDRAKLKKVSYIGMWVMRLDDSVQKGATDAPGGNSRKGRI